MSARVRSHDEGREARSLQDGIYYEKDDRPGRCYRLVLINIADGTPRRQAGAAIATVWAMLDKLRQGVVADLGSEGPALDAEVAKNAELKCLLAFGASLFSRYRGEVDPPRAVVLFGDLRFPSLPTVPVPERDIAEADVALQLIANTELAVDRALVEMWMLIDEKKLPLEIVTFHRGFNRDDRRSWLGFHDGINNVEPEGRRQVLEVAVKDPPWMLGGTYMGFLRLLINLKAWRKLPRDRQEILVGRDKITGCPLEAVDARGQPVRLSNCPVGEHSRGSAVYVTPPAPAITETLLRKSHIHRANPNRRGTADGDNRIFRQGYEFLEAAGSGNLRVGLNFVSFQRDLARLSGILTQFSWLGDANFGGVADGDPNAFSFVSLLGGGAYAVPPRGSPFPGAEIF